MRVLEIVAAGYAGGGTNHVLQLLRSFKHQWSLALVTQPRSYLFEEAVTLGVPCFGTDFFFHRVDVRVARTIRQVVAEVRPDVIHVHGGRAAFFLAFAGVSVPIIYTVHGFHFTHKRFWSRWPAVLGERLAMKQAAHVIFVSRYDRAVAQTHRLLGSKQSFSIIHNGIPAPHVDSRSEKADTRLIGFIGRMEYQKDPILFLDCLQQLSGYRAVMIGAGALEANVRREVVLRGLDDRVTMQGTMTHQQTLQILCTLGVLVMTSRWEGLPLLPIEALWLGVPVVAADVGGMGEIIQDQENGMLIGDRSPVTFARAVRRVSEDDSLRTHMIHNGRRRMKDMFSEAQMLGEIRALYERACMASGNHVGEATDDGRNHAAR